MGFFFSGGYSAAAVAVYTTELDSSRFVHLFDTAVAGNTAFAF